MAAPASRYDLLAKLASGGMGTVYVGRVRGPLGFSRLVAIKRAHPHLADDPAFSRMLIDEAKLASKISHPHVVAVLDVERVRDGAGPDRRKEIRLVMDYVEGATLLELMTLARGRGLVMSPGVAVRIVLDAAAGLQAAHDVSDEHGEPLGIVHRDISPHNVLVGIDGMARLSDFGIAKATMRPGQTTSGELKGKLAYMAPEYVSSSALDARSDVFSLGVVAWEALAGERLFRGESEVDTLQIVAAAKIRPLSSVRPEIGPALEDVLAAALTKDPEQRFSSARAFGNALESEARRAGLVAPHTEVAAFVRRMTMEILEKRRTAIRQRAKELDALMPSGPSTQSEDLREAVNAAQAVIRERAHSVPDTGRVASGIEVDVAAVAPQPEGTLAGTGKTGRTPKPRPRASMWLLAFAIGAGLAVALFMIMRSASSDRGPKDPSSAASSSATSLPSSPPSAPVVAPASAPSSSASALASPSASARPSASTRASSKPQQPLPPRHNELPPNPYNTARRN